MDRSTWEKLKALRPLAPRMIHSAAAFGTYKQPDNNRRLRRQAIKDFGVRQLKRAIYKQRHEGYANA